MTMTFRFFAAASPCTKGLPPIRAVPSARPAVSRRKSRLLRPRWLAMSDRAEIVVLADDALNSNSPFQIHSLISSVMHESFSRLCDRAGFRRVYKLLNLGSFFINCGHMFRLEPLIDGELLLGLVLLSGANIILAETVVSVWRVGVQFERPLVFR